MKRFFRSTLAIAISAVFIVAPSTTSAQDIGGDDLSAFEADLFSNQPVSDISPETVKTEYLVGGTVAVNALAGFTTAFDELSSRGAIAGKLFAKVSVPDYGTLYVAYNVSHALLQTYSGTGTPAAASNPYLPTYALSELHYSFDIAKKLFVRVGNQLIAWGPSRVWSPVDFINLEKNDAFASLDERAGKPGLRLHLPLKGSNAFVFADFGDFVSRSASSSTGWIAEDPFEAIKFGGRYDFTAGSFEFGLTGYGGLNAQARFGMDASGRLLGTTVYAEAAFKPEYSDYQSSALVSVGFSRSLDERRLWTLSGEGFWNSRGQDLSGTTAAGLMTLPSEDTRSLYQGVFYAYGSLSAAELFSPSLTTTLTALANLTELSYRVTLSESFAFPRALRFTLALSYAGGGADKEFTRFTGDGAMSVQLSTRVEF